MDILGIFLQQSTLFLISITKQLCLDQDIELCFFTNSVLVVTIPLTAFTIYFVFLIIALNNRPHFLLYIIPVSFTQ